MARRNQNRELAFVINDVARLLRTAADQRAAEHGMTRAKWAVLARLDRFEGLKQAELAEMLDLQPISLTRLLDGLDEAGLIERRADPTDRRANRLYLTPAARPVLDCLTDLGEELMQAVLAGLGKEDAERLLVDLSTVKDNLREIVTKRHSSAERRYG